MKAEVVISLFSASLFAQSYPPAAGEPGSTAIFRTNPSFVAWATGITVQRGFVNAADPSITANGSNLTSAGLPNAAIGIPNGDTVSLGDGGSATLTFALPIINGAGFDFAVFENGSTAYLELGFVEVSSDGENFFRFPAHSQTQTATQLGTFDSPSAAYLNNLAGKYSAEYGTPFDLDDLPDDELLDKNNVTHVRVVDVVGSVNPDYGSTDNFGNLVNDSFPTPFVSGGFDLQAVGVINQMLDNDGFVRQAIAVYPNPAQDFLTFTIPVIELEITDASGRTVFHHRGETDKVDVSSLASGTYLISLSDGQATSIHRFLKK